MFALGRRSDNITLRQHHSHQQCTTKTSSARVGVASQQRGPKRKTSKGEQSKESTRERRQAHRRGEIGEIDAEVLCDIFDRVRRCGSRRRQQMLLLTDPIHNSLLFRV